jgi:hypothetical protein
VNLLLGAGAVSLFIVSRGGRRAARTAAETGGSSKSRKAPLSKQNYFVAVRGGQAATLTIVKFVRNFKREIKSNLVGTRK